MATPMLTDSIIPVWSLNVCLMLSRSCPTGNRVFYVDIYYVVLVHCRYSFNMSVTNKSLTKRREVLREVILRHSVTCLAAQVFHCGKDHSPFLRKSLNFEPFTFDMIQLCTIYNVTEFSKCHEVVHIQFSGDTLTHGWRITVRVAYLFISCSLSHSRTGHHSG